MNDVVEGKAEIWCESDKHALFENFADFNDWLEGDAGQFFRDAMEIDIDSFSQPSKALYASDREAYQQLFERYRIDRRAEVLNRTYLEDQFSDDHWYRRNLDRFELLIGCLRSFSVVPFIGAGMSVSGGFPTWQNHLREQGRTAGVPPVQIETLLDAGQYEGVIQLIEATKGRDVFVNELRDVFSRVGTLTTAMLLLRELFQDTVITTNYDSLLEQAYDVGKGDEYQVINATSALSKPAADLTTIYKLHGDVTKPGQCILGKNQYDDAYGAAELDLKKAIPKLLQYHYRASNLLFLGCSLNEDRTIEVFRAVRASMGEAETPLHFSIEQAPEDEAELVNRNAYLAALGISPIWFEKGRFDVVDEILQLAKNELHHRGVRISRPGTNNNAIERGGILARCKRLFGKRK